MNDEEGQTPARAKDFWAGEGLTFVIVENTIDLGAFDPIVAAIQPEFSHITISRRVAGPMAGGFMPEAAIYAVFTAIAIPFLAELGKDAYRAFRSALFEAYSRAKTWANDRGYEPLTIELEKQPGAIAFLFPEGLDREAFETAIQQLIQAYSRDDLPAPTDDPKIPSIMQWDASSESWTLDERF